MNLSLNRQKEQEIGSRSISTQLTEQERGDRKSTSSTDLSEQGNEEENNCQRSTRKAAIKTYNTCDILTDFSDEESKSSSASDSNDDGDPAWIPAPLKVIIYKHIL